MPSADYKKLQQWWSGYNPGSDENLRDACMLLSHYTGWDIVSLLEMPIDELTEWLERLPKLREMTEPALPGPALPGPALPGPELPGPELSG